jgi:hypothetical protein
MISRNLARRIKQLEVRSALANPPEHIATVRFINPDGTVSSTLVMGPNGKRTWTDLTDPSNPRTWTEYDHGHGSQSSNNEDNHAPPSQT